MKSLLIFSVFLFISYQQIYADILDDLDHHGDHDDHDDHLDDHDDHLDDLNDHLDDLNDLDDDHPQSDLELQLLKQIEEFLPNSEPATFVVQQGDPVNLQKSLDFGIPLVPEIPNEPHGEPPQTFSAPAQPQEQPIQESFGVPVDQSIGVPLPQPLQQPEQQQFHSQPQQPEQQQFHLEPQQPPQSQPIFESIPQDDLSVINPPVIQEVHIAIDSDENLNADFPVLDDPAPLGISPAHEDYEDIQNNLIGGQGRQLNSQKSSASIFNPHEGDYPRYDIVPRTSFSCGDHDFGGYYADTEAECQVFHICLSGDIMGSFLCPNGTLFNQELFVCDWWFNVDCSLASQSYQLNARIGVVDSDEDLS